MDKELEQAQDLTRDDLVAKLEHGRPAQLSRPNQRAKAVVEAATKGKPHVRGMVLWPGGEPQDRIVLTREQPEPIRIKGSRLRTGTEV
jgi:hypothetical protein